MSGTTQNAISASHAARYLLTSSFNSYTGTTNTIIGSLQTSTGSLNTYTSSNNSKLEVIESTTSSLNTFTSSANGRLNSIEGVTGSYATTGSNTFNGNLTVTGYIDAQELRTTYISSSILYRSGSTKFGDELTDTHVFTGSVLISGSLSVPGQNIITRSGGGEVNELTIFNGTNTVGGTSALSYNFPQLAVGVSSTGNNSDYNLLIHRHGNIGNPGSGTSTPALYVTDFAGDGPASYSNLPLVEISYPRINSTDTNAANASLLRLALDDMVAMQISAKGRTFIGQSSQTDNGQILQVNGTSRFDGNSTFTSDVTVSGKMGIGGAPESGYVLTLKGNGVDSPLLLLQGLANPTAKLGDTTTGTSDVGNLWLYNDGTLRIRLDSDTAGTSYINAGNFLIGSNTGVGYKVEIFQSNEDILRIHNTTTTGDAVLAFTNADGTLGRIQGVDGGGFVVDTPGIDRTNFLIGLNSTTIPNSAANRGNLIVNGANSSIIQLTTDGNQKGYFYHNGTTMDINNAANGDIELFANNTLIAAVKAATSGQRNFVVGNAVALATAANRANITINGASNSILSFGVSNTLKGYLYNNGTDFFLNTGAGKITFENDVATSMVIASNGYVGVRTNPSYQFEVNGGSGGINLITDATAASATSPNFSILQTGASRSVTGYNYESTQPLVMIIAESANTTLGLSRMSADSTGAVLRGMKARGTSAAPSSVLDGDVCFAVEGYAWHGSGPNHPKLGGGLRFVKDDNWGTANTFAPMRTEFYNANSGTSSQTTMALYPSGLLTLPTTVGTSKFNITSGGITKQHLVNSKTAAASGTALKLFYVGFSHSVRLFLYILQDTNNIATGIADFTTAYGASSGGITQSIRLGNISSISASYNNGGSPAYTIDVTVNYSGAAPTIYATIEGISNDSMYLVN